MNCLSSIIDAIGHYFTVSCSRKVPGGTGVVPGSNGVTTDRFDEKSAEEKKINERLQNAVFLHFTGRLSRRKCLKMSDIH